MSLINIEHSLTGRKDAQISNIFIMEAVQLILNAIFYLKKDILIVPIILYVSQLKLQLL